MNVRLQMTFILEDGKKANIFMPVPRSTLTGAETLSIMNAIIAADVFRPKGLRLVEAHAAKIVRSETTELIVA